MAIGMILDIVVILLLVPTIVYAFILNSRLRTLHRSREELSKVVNSFNEATMRAEAGIPKLKKATTEANHTLKDRVEKAQTLRDDLAFMIERAEELAARLEGAVRSARNEGAMTQGPASQPAPQPSAVRPLNEPAQPMRGQSPVTAGTLTAATLAQTAAGFEETAAELRNALGAARAEAARVASGQAPAGMQAAAGMSAGVPPRPKRTMAGVMGTAVGGERPLAERAVMPDPVDEERSEAERELLKALQSAR
jgi:uncharacterized phage infection (PIP) family protein YhgE